jgi:MoxR-like ATPase
VNKRWKQRTDVPPAEDRANMLSLEEALEATKVPPAIPSKDFDKLNNSSPFVEPEKVMDGPELLKWQALVRQVILADHIRDYIVRLTLATHPEGPLAAEITNRYLRWGSSPRGAQTMALAAKVRALLDGRFNVSFEDVRRTYLPALRHRVIANFEALAEGISNDQILAEILEKTPQKADG